MIVKREIGSKSTGNKHFMQLCDFFILTIVFFRMICVHTQVNPTLNQ